MDKNVYINVKYIIKDIIHMNIIIFLYDLLLIIVEKILTPDIIISILLSVEKSLKKGKIHIIIEIIPTI